MYGINGMMLRRIKICNSNFHILSALAKVNALKKQHYLRIKKTLLTILMLIAKVELEDCLMNRTWQTTQTMMKTRMMFLAAKRAQMMLKAGVTIKIAREEDYNQKKKKVPLMTTIMLMQLLL